MHSISGGSGVVGQPDAASVEQGNKITEEVVRRLKAVVEDLGQVAP